MKPIRYYVSKVLVKMYVWAKRQRLIRDVVVILEKLLYTTVDRRLGWIMGLKSKIARNYTEDGINVVYQNVYDHRIFDYLPANQIVTLPLDELIYPFREDILLRVDFLQSMEELVGLRPEQTLYYQFIGDKERGGDYDSKEIADNFFKIYESIKKNGYIGGEYKDSHITVIQTPEPYMPGVPPKHERVRRVNSHYALKEGAHRVAALKMLGYEKAECRIVEDYHFSPPDYTEYIRRNRVKYIKNLLSNVHTIYQPIPFSEFRDVSTGHESYERLRLILDNVDCNGLKVLDIGCSLGYFCYQLAKKGAIVTGIDADPEQIYIDRKVCELYNLNITFRQAFLDMDLITSLEQYDCIIMLNILHHIMANAKISYHWKLSGSGLDYSRELLKALAGKCNGVLFFAMAQTGETPYWTEILPDMVPAPDVWIKKELLEAASFDKVTIFPPGQIYPPSKIKPGSQNNRYIFKAEKKRQ